MLRVRKVLDQIQLKSCGFKELTGIISKESNEERGIIGYSAYHWSPAPLYKQDKRRGKRGRWV